MPNCCLSAIGTCFGTPYLEQNAEFVGHSVLGVAPEAWGNLDYFKYRDAADFEANAPCGQAANNHVDACNARYSNGRIEVHSTDAVDNHELVHSYAFSLGYPPTFLLEGLAVALSCEPGIETIVLDTTPLNRIGLPASWESLLDLGAAEDAYTFIARGTFVTWLIDHAGIPPLLDVYKEVPANATAAEFATSIQNHFGTSLDTLWQTASGEPLRRTCTSVSSCTVLDPTQSVLNRSYPAVPIPKLGLIAVSPNADVSGTSPPAVRVCSATAASAFDLEWPLDLETPVTTAIFLPASDGTILTSSSDANGTWNHGPAAPTDYQATTLDPSSVNSSCSSAAAIQVADTRVGLQIGAASRPDHISTSAREHDQLRRGIRLWKPASLHSGRLHGLPGRRSVLQFLDDLHEGKDNGHFALCVPREGTANKQIFPGDIRGKRDRHLRGITGIYQHFQNGVSSLFQARNLLIYQAPPGRLELPTFGLGTAISHEPGQLVGQQNYCSFGRF